MKNEFIGTRTLIGLILRRDRVALLVWIVLPILFILVTKSSFAQLYPTPALMREFADEVASNPAEIALLGPVYTPTLAGIVVWRVSMLLAILVGLANAFTVTRHTRTEEETGRRELLGSTVVGRYAPLLAVLLVVGAANLLIALLITSGLSIAGFSVAGSLALGFSLAALGWTFGGIASVIAQVMESTRSANGTVGAVFAFFYLLRIVGDTGKQNGLFWLSWISPLGWMRLIRPYADERWWLFVLFIVFIVALSTLAYMLTSRRDLGTGLLPPRLGPATAAPGLRSPLALAWRLQRGMLLSWTLGFVVIGIVFGFVAKTVADQLSANPSVMRLLVHMGNNVGAGDGFFTLALEIFGEVAAAYAILATLRLRSEEVSGRAEPILANAVGRISWAISHLLFAMLGPTVVLTVFGLAAGLTYGLSAGTVGTELPRVLAAALVYLPAAWVLGAITAMMFGLLPRFAAVISWTILGICLLIDFGGELQQVSQAVLNISPFTHIPKLLVTQASVLPLIGLIVIAAAFTVVGLAGFRQRAIE